MHKTLHYQQIKEQWHCEPQVYVYEFTDRKLEKITFLGCYNAVFFFEKSKAKYQANFQYSKQILNILFTNSRKEDVNKF